MKYLILFSVLLAGCAESEQTQAERAAREQARVAEREALLAGLTGEKQVYVRQ